MAYENFTIRQFEKAWLGKDYSEISKDVFETVYYEYIDTTMAYMSSHFDKVVYIRLLENRINTIGKFITLQTIFLEEFGQPYTEAFEIVKEFGYSIKWKGDRELFLDQLISMKEQESSVESDLKISVKELQDLQKKRTETTSSER